MQHTYNIIKCNTCGFCLFAEDNGEVDQASHTQDHVAVNHAVPEWTRIVVDHDKYWDEWEYSLEMHRQYQSEIRSGYMPNSTYSQWWIHTEMLVDQMGEDEDARFSKEEGQ